VRRELNEAIAYLEGKDKIARHVLEHAKCFGAEGFWFGREDALKLLDLLDSHGATVLGGEVAFERDGELELSGDDWHCDSCVRKETIDHSKEFVASYEGDDPLFHIVWKDAIGRYEDLMKRAGGIKGKRRWTGNKKDSAKNRK